MSSTETGRDSHTSGDFENSITENGLPVKEQFSISEPVEQTGTLLAMHNAENMIVQDDRTPFQREIARQLGMESGDNRCLPAIFAAALYRSK
ncbi:MAG: hypothetical protein ACI3VJ_06205 [Hominicoprocola sp.]